MPPPESSRPSAHVDESVKEEGSATTSSPAERSSPAAQETAFVPAGTVMGPSNSSSATSRSRPDSLALPVAKAPTFSRLGADTMKVPSAMDSTVPSWNSASRYTRIRSAPSESSPV